MSRIVTVAATQMACSWDTAANIAKAEKLVRQAAAQGAQIILIQELFETPYFCQKPNPQYLQLATPVEQNPAIQIVGLQPQEGAAIPGIRRWPEEYLPKIYQAERVDQIIDMGQAEAEHVMRRLAREEGIFCGVSSGGSVAGMLRLSQQVENAVLVAIICDRGDRYLSSGVYQEPAH